LIFGDRGNTRTVLTVFGPKAPLHSGYYGNYAPNPAMRLAQLLATMKDKQGRVLVNGYYDRIKLTAEERKSWLIPHFPDADHFLRELVSFVMMTSAWRTARAHRTTR
jgi:acetylornithine deacetylase/succinyl-diaminopimelate desuccinylase-like protein